MAAAVEKPAKVLYTAKTHTTGGREKGLARSSDGRLEVRLSTPGAAGQGTNPEQLFAAGWSACFEGAMAGVARKRKIALPDDLAIDAEVDLNLGDDGYFLRARLNVSCARHGTGNGSGVDRRGSPDLPLFQGDTRQRRRNDHPRLSGGPHGLNGIRQGRHRTPRDRSV